MEENLQVGVVQLCRPHGRLPLTKPPIACLRIHSMLGPTTAMVSNDSEFRVRSPTLPLPIMEIYVTALTPFADQWPNRAFSSKAMERIFIGSIVIALPLVTL